MQHAFWIASKFSKAEINTETSVLDKSTDVMIKDLTRTKRIFNLFSDACYRTVLHHFDSHALNDFMCDQVGLVHDCYILHSRSLDEPFQLFQQLLRLEIVYGSNENEYPSNGVQDLVSFDHPSHRSQSYGHVRSDTDESESCESWTTRF